MKKSFIFMVSIFVVVLLLTYINLTADERNNNQESELLAQEKAMAIEVNSNSNNSAMTVDIQSWADTDDKEGLSLKFCDYITERPEEFYEIMKDNEEIFIEWVTNLGVNVFTSWNGETNRDEIRRQMTESLSNVILDQPMDDWNRYLLSKLEKIKVITFEKNDFDSEIDWERLYVAWEGYINYPNADNALRVYRLLPNEQYIRHGEMTENGKKCWYAIANNIEILEHQVISGDRAAVQLAFKFKVIADGAFSESLNIMLGKLIRINPKMFLEELKRHYSLISGINFILRNSSNIYVDRLEAYLYEIQQRIKAIESITDPALEEIKTECLRVLNARRELPSEYFPAWIR